MLDDAFDRASAACRVDRIGTKPVLAASRDQRHAQSAGIEHSDCRTQQAKRCPCLGCRACSVLGNVFAACSYRTTTFPKLDKGMQTSRLMHTYQIKTSIYQPI